MNHHEAFTVVPGVVNHSQVNERKAELDTITGLLTATRARLTHLLQRRKDIDAALMEATVAATQAQVAALLHESVDVKAAAKHHATLLSERAMVQQEMETLPAMIGEFKRRAVLADFGYLQLVRSVALAEAERINTEVDRYRVQQQSVQRQIAALTPPPVTFNARPLNRRNEERDALVADRAYCDAQHVTLVEQSREIAAEALPSVSSLNLARLAADVAKAMMDNYVSHLGRAVSPAEAAQWWCEQSRTAAEREIAAAGTVGTERRVGAPA